MRLFLCGDVMTGRGIDQVLSHSVDPVLYEGFVKDASARVQFDRHRRRGGLLTQVKGQTMLFCDSDTRESRYTRSRPRE